MSMKSTEKLTFILIFRYLLESGIPLIHSLNIIEKTFIKYASKINQVRRMVNNGQPLFYSLQKSNLFNQFETSIIKIGENTENLHYALKKLEDLLVKRQNLSQNMIKSLIYPLIFLFVLSFIMILFKNLIIPAFTNLYVDMGITPPAAFKFLSFLTIIFDIKVVIFLGILIGSLLFIIINLFKANLKIFYRYIFSMPVIGKIFYNSYVSLVLNLWATSLESGLPYSLTFKILEEETVEPFSSFFSKMYDRTKKGELYEIVNFDNTFKTMYVKQMNAALESGEVPFTLRKLAEMAEIEANAALDTFNRVIEPAMAIIAGFITATLCLSIFSPIMYLIRSM